MLVSIGRQYQMQDQDAKARRVLGQAYDLARTLPEPSIRAKAACAYADAIALGGDTQKAEALFESAQREFPREPQFAVDRIACLMRGSAVAQERGAMPVGVERAEAARQLLRETPSTSALLRLVVTMRVAESYRLAGRFRDADAGFEDAYAQLTKLGREKTERAGTLLNNWGVTMSQLGRPLDAERLLRRAVLISTADGTEESVSPMLLNNLARTLRNLHRLPAARDYAERAYAKARAAGNEVVVTQSLSVRASIYRLMGNLDRAAETLAEFEKQIKPLPPEHVAFARLAAEESLLAAARHDWPRAIAASDRALAATRTEHLRDYQAEFLVGRAGIDLENDRVGDAQAHAAQALELKKVEVRPGDTSADIGHAYLLLGRALLAQAKVAEARAAFASAIEHLTPTLGADDPDTRLATRLANKGSGIRDQGPGGQPDP
jgi:tetratricopeptide (TPR) repeat protein